MTSLNENDLSFVERFLHAFKVLGGNEEGTIDYEEFKATLLNIKGETGKEIIKSIEDEQYVNDNKLNFFNLCSSILTTKAIFNRLSSENGRVVASGPQINTRTYTRKKNNTQVICANKRNAKKLDVEKTFTQQIKGSVYNINDDLLSNRYQLEVLENTSVEIFAGPVTSDVVMPFEILVFQENKSFLASSSFLTSEGYNAVSLNLKKGKYLIIPILLKWNKCISDQNEPPSLDALIELDDESQASLTHACEKALNVIYDSIDLDGNGLLSQLEFDLFIQHTSGETAEDEWSTIEDNFQVENHQLTFEGFLELYKMVLNTDPADVINMLQQMGMNHLLEQKNACPFMLVVKSETSKCILTPLTVSSCSNIIEKILCKMAVEQGSSINVKNMNDLLLYIHRLPQRVTIVIQNQSHSKVTVRLDCTESSNCESHRNTLDYSVEVPPRMSKIGHHLFPVDSKMPWSVACVESLK